MRKKSLLSKAQIEALKTKIAFLLSQKSYKREDLLRELNTPVFMLHDRTMRKLVEEMVIGGEHCIASSETGYSIIHTKEEMEKAVEYLRKKAKPIAIRANCLIRNYNKMLPAGEQVQMQLFNPMIFPVM